MTADTWPKKAETQYFALAGYAEMRQSVLARMLQRYVTVTDLYGKLICEVTLILGQSKPETTVITSHQSPNVQLDITLRDLMADTFDILFEARALILKGKLEIAYPLARRAYESLSLMDACYLDPKLAKRWMSGKEVVLNKDVRSTLGKHLFGELEEKTRALHKFFTDFSHPNRKMMAQRCLGNGNEFVLGAVGIPSLALLADYALKTLDLWFWFAALVSWIYLPVISEANPIFKEGYDEATTTAKEVASFLVEQFNLTLRQEKAQQIRDRSHGR
jgi:hypothetical protein